MKFNFWVTVDMQSATPVDEPVFREALVRACGPVLPPRAILHVQPIPAGFSCMLVSEADLWAKAGPYIDWPYSCPSCRSNWSQKIYNTGACEECACRFEWVLAEPAPGQKFDRQSFGRYLESQGRKPARFLLMAGAHIWRFLPLHIVFWIFSWLGGFGSAWILLKALRS